MSVVSDMLQPFAELEQLAQDLGDRPYTVTLRQENYSGKIALNVTRTSITGAITLAPRPKVVPVSGPKADWFGAGTLLHDATGVARVSVYRIGPIVPSWSGGGYTPAQLLPTLTDPTTTRWIALLEGPGLASGGEPHKVVDADFSDPLGYYLTVARCAVIS